MDAATIAHVLARGRRRARRRANLTAYAFMAPSLVFFVGFLLIPIGWVARQSFMEGGVLGPARWVGLENWSDLAADPKASAAIRNTFLYAGLSIPLMLALALVVAIGLKNLRRGGTALRVAIYLPSLAPFVLGALVWIFMVHPDFGLFNVGTRVVGAEPINWLGSQTLALPTLALLEVWRGIGFWGIFLLAGLLGIPRDLYQAAALDGASATRRFLHVSLPGIRPTLITALLLSSLFAMQVFESPFVLTKGGPANSTQTALLYSYQTIFEQGNPGLGAAMCIILLAIVLTVTALSFMVGGRRGRAGPRAGRSR